MVVLHRSLDPGPNQALADVVDRPLLILEHLLRRPVELPRDRELAEPVLCLACFT